MKNIAIYILLILFAMAISNWAFGQSVVPNIALSDTLEKVEQSTAYKEHQKEVEQLKKNAQYDFDQLLQNHDAIINTVKNNAAQEINDDKITAVKELELLKKEEETLQKAIKKENKKNNSWLQKQIKKSAKKVNTEEEEL